MLAHSQANITKGMDVRFDVVVIVVGGKHEFKIDVNCGLGWCEGPLTASTM